MTRRINIPLEVIKIDTPCRASWDKMRGDERMRFCEECSLHVYDISAMTREAATELVSQREGRLCIRMYRRDDGTVITKDCGGGFRAATKRAVRFAGAAASVVLCAAMTPFFVASSNASNATPRTTSSASLNPMSSFMKYCIEPFLPKRAMDSPAPMTGKPRVEIGDMVMPPTMGIMAQPSTQPTTQPATQPSTQPTRAMMGEMVAPTTQPGDASE
ncbi:hypothetical protein BH09PLA1_BH09PLA1_36290 [soil metagenome]